jgi:glycine amidinotransferase
MSEKQPKVIVNSWNEWDPLKHVILGRPDGGMIQAPEPAISWAYPEDSWPRGKYGPLPKEMEEVAIEQMDRFAATMESRGICVDRTTPMDFGQTVQTPDWVQRSMVSCMPPRDILLTVGNEIVEAAMSYRSRWYEYICLRPLLERYFKEDPNFRWEAAPKPRMTDDSYVSNDFWEEFESKSYDEQLEHTYRRQWNLTEKEPIWEAADVARLGKDLFIQRSTVTNGAGIEWLRRHFPDHRVHEVTFKEPNPGHIDATLVPIRPGLAMLNRARPPLQEELLQLFRINDWQLIECAPPAHDKRRPLCQCSIWLSLNIVMLDPNTVCVPELETAQIEQFVKLGLEVIPVPFWDVAPFGGGLHCSTADVYREGDLEDYFPKQIPGF